MLWRDGSVAEERDLFGAPSAFCPKQQLKEEEEEKKN